MSNKTYKGLISICKSCGEIQGYASNCEKCFGGKGHLKVIADTDDARLVRVLAKYICDSSEFRGIECNTCEHSLLDQDSRECAACVQHSDHVQHHAIDLAQQLRERGE